MEKCLFVRELTWDAAPSVESLVDHFTCKYVVCVCFKEVEEQSDKR